MKTTKSSRTKNRDPTDKATRAVTSYYAGLFAALKTGGHTFTAATYDWRVGCRGLSQWRADLKSLIESYNEPVVLVAHSMGCMQCNFFLNSMTADWRNQHIAAFVSAGGPYIGAPKVLKGIISGDDLGITTLPASDAQILQRNSGAGTLVSPLPSERWGPAPLLTAGSETYLWHNISLVFDKLNISAPYKYETVIFPGVTADAGVPVYLVRGTGVKTVVGVSYPRSDFSGSVNEIFGDGDGTVPTASSTYPLAAGWGQVIDYPMSGVKHLDLIANQDFYKLVATLANQK